jgi:hypothetical protein
VTGAKEHRKRDTGDGQMQKIETRTSSKYLRFDGTDLEIRAQLCNESVTIKVMKAGTCVHRLTIDDAVNRLEHGWIADMFAREDRVALSELAHEAEDFVGGLNINQG